MDSASAHHDFDGKYLYVPPLVCLCIRQLAAFPDQISGVALSYAPTRDFDILQALIPSYSEDSDSFSISSVDPFLWATLIQVYGATLPEIFNTYPIPLIDTRLSLLQRIQTTPTFALLTVLELPGCAQLTDDTVANIRSLHSLIAFDASETRFSSWGLKKLLMPPALAVEESASSGPWGLRILRLRNCKAIDHGIFKFLQRLLLLSVLDLRGTSIVPRTIPAPYSGWSSTSLEQSLLESLYHPTPLIKSLSSLRNTSTNFHISTTTFQLHIDRIDRSIQQDNTPISKTAVKIEGEAFTFIPDSTMLTHAPPPMEADSSQSRRNIDYMLSVVEQESREMAAHQKLRDFYAPIRRVGASSIPSNRQAYSAEKYYKEYARKERRNSMIWSSLDVFERPRKKQKLSGSQIFESCSPTSNGSQLMLYRSPPPWSSLEPNYESNLSSSGRPASTAQTASVNKSKMQFIADLNVNVGIAPRSRRARSTMATFDGTNSHSKYKPSPSDVTKKNVVEMIRPILQGKNPFRRPTSTVARSTGIISSGSLSGSRGASADVALMSTTESPGQEPSSTRNETYAPKRPLKPISSVRIPELPPEELRKLKESMMTKKPRVSLPLSTPAASGSDTSNSSRRKSLPTSATSGKDGDIKKILLQQIAGSHKPSSVSGNSKSSSSSGPGTSTFDWKAWGKDS